VTKHIAVIGLGFGDEGKGHLVDYLCDVNKAELVVRFSGGHQAAHQVVLEDGRSHVFSHFGSGSFRGVPTFWSKYCSVNPVALMNELDVLLVKKVFPRLLVDHRCPVTTPFEIEWNKRNSDFGGSCEVGIFATVKREREGHHLLFEDLFHPRIMRMKMEQFYQYYGFRPDDYIIQNFFVACDEVTHNAAIGMSNEQVIDSFETVIWEGSQGLLLDQNFGFFPYVTPTNTGSKNICEMGYEPEIVLVTRAYQTRHGKGPMSDIVPCNIKDNPHEQNPDDGPQGTFRKTLLDLDLLSYAIYKDDYIMTKTPELAVTCLDLINDDFRFFDGGEILKMDDDAKFLAHIREVTGADAVLASLSPTAKGIVEVIRD